MCQTIFLFQNAFIPMDLLTITKAAVAAVQLSSLSLSLDISKHSGLLEYKIQQQQQQLLLLTIFSLPVVVLSKSIGASRNIEAKAVKQKYFPHRQMNLNEPCREDSVSTVCLYSLSLVLSLPSVQFNTSKLTPAHFSFHPTQQQAAHRELRS